MAKLNHTSSQVRMTIGITKIIHLANFKQPGLLTDVSIQIFLIFIVYVTQKLKKYKATMDPGGQNKGWKLEITGKVS